MLRYNAGSLDRFIDVTDSLGLFVEVLSKKYCFVCSCMDGPMSVARATPGLVCFGACRISDIVWMLIRQNGRLHVHI